LKRRSRKLENWLTQAEQTEDWLHRHRYIYIGNSENRGGYQIKILYC